MNRTIMSVAIAAGVISAIALGFGIGAVHDANHAESVNSTLTSQAASTGRQIAGLESRVSKLQTQLNAASVADKNAINAHEGICYSVNYTNGNGVEWVSDVVITPPTVDNGVYECDNGETYVSVTPAAAGQS
jgi:hypothetical protein